MNRVRDRFSTCAALCAAACVLLLLAQAYQLWRYGPGLLTAAITVAVAAFVIALEMFRRHAAAMEKLNRYIMALVMHDIKNPLASILMSVTSAEQDERNSPSTRELLSMARKSSLFQQRVIESLQTIVCIEAGDCRLSPHPIRLTDLLDDCLVQTQALSYGRHIRIEIKKSDKFPSIIRADVEMLRSVLVNLLLDSIKYTPKTGAITITAEAENKTVSIEIADTGHGVDPAYLETFFLKYTDVNVRKKSARKGIGLNLYFCRLAVEAHGGKISAANLPEGFAVKFTLPQAE